jgi:peptide subunit release factor RF-3
MTVDRLLGDPAAEIARRRTRSDWMGIERERGISVVTSVMARGRAHALLDACAVTRMR